MKELPTPTLMLRTNSLSFRLGALAVVWSVFGFAAGVLVLSRVFRESVERSFDNRLGAELVSVIEVTELDCQGTIVMPQLLLAERFRNPFSGWYWQMSSTASPSRPLTRSRSLWDQWLKLDPVATGAVRMGYVTGPKQQNLRYAERIVSLPAPDETEDGQKCTGADHRNAALAGT